jgi:hypothetical protein
MPPIVSVCPPDSAFSKLLQADLDILCYLAFPVAGGNAAENLAEMQYGQVAAHATSGMLLFPALPLGGAGKAAFVAAIAFWPLHDE